LTAEGGTRHRCAPSVCRTTVFWPSRMRRPIELSAAAAAQAS
jgi:hypothetical protein